MSKSVKKKPTIQTATSGKNRLLYVVSYDIAEDKRRNKIAKVLEGYGKRVQYSVFECRVSLQNMKKLYAQLCDLTQDMEEGSILFYPICGSCEKKVMLIGARDEEEKELQEAVIVV